MIFQSIAGFFVFSGIAFLIGENRKQVRVKLVIAGTLATCMTGAVIGIIG